MIDRFQEKKCIHRLGLRLAKRRNISCAKSLCNGNLSKDVFERRMSTGSEAFFLFICLDAIKFSLLTFFSLLKTIYPRVLTKPLPNDAKSPLPVDVRRSKTLLLKFNRSSMRRSISSPDQTPRRELKIRRAAEYF